MADLWFWNCYLFVKTKGYMHTESPSLRELSRGFKGKTHELGDVTLWLSLPCEYAWYDRLANSATCLWVAKPKLFPGSYKLLFLFPFLFLLFGVCDCLHISPKLRFVQVTSAYGWYWNQWINESWTWIYLHWAEEEKLVKYPQGKQDSCSA